MTEHLPTPAQLAELESDAAIQAEMDRNARLLVRHADLHLDAEGSWDVSRHARHWDPCEDDDAAADRAAANRMWELCAKHIRAGRIERARFAMLGALVLAEPWTDATMARDMAAALEAELPQRPRR